MASAIIPTRNNQRSSNFITKFDHIPNPNFNNFPKLQKTQNPNPNFKNFVTGNTSRHITPPATSGYNYITFRLSSYTKTELKGLRKRLISDLNRVRILKQFVYSVYSVPVRETCFHAPEPKEPTGSVASLTGVKRTRVVSLPVRDAKKQRGRVSNASKRKLMMKECGQILGKLMKHKHGWVFNKPVDAGAMKLYDYHNVIRKPMDLGTIKAKLGKNGYKSPVEFAEDVRLTFENAMVYNGRGSNVFVMAERLLLLFEDMYVAAHPKFVANRLRTRNVPVSNATVVVDTDTDKDMDTPVVTQNLDVELGKQMMVNKKLGGDMGKPMMIRAVNKREMTVEEKAELAASFLKLHLGREGMHQIMAIVKKGAGLEREGDEIELDLAVLDNETLWELHRFIGRSLENKAATASATGCNMNGVVTDLTGSVQTDNCRERDAGEEDVDIGEEEMQLTNYPSVVIEKDVVNGSDSNSNSSSSDSSSDSDSSSSDSGSGTSYNEHEVNSTPKGVV